MQVESSSLWLSASSSTESKLDVWSENVVQSLERWVESALNNQLPVSTGDGEALSVISGAARTVSTALEFFR